MVTTVNSLWLPSELQREVFSFCDSHTLAVACLLSRDLLDDSRDILYHTVKISDIGAARMVSNASQLIPRIRHLHAIITGAGGHNASWISLLTILKNANVIGTLNLIPPPILSFRTTPEIVASIDELSQVSSVHTFMAVWPDVEVASQFGWTFSSLALWGGRLKGLHIRDFRRYHERPEILGIKQDKPVLDALELGQYIHPAPTSFQIHKVRKLAVMLGNHDFHEDKIRDILKHMVQTLELFVFSWFGNYERGPTFPKLDHPLTSLTTIVIFSSTVDLITAYTLPFLQGISSHAPNLATAKLFLDFSGWDASLESVLIGNKDWIGVAEFLCGLPNMKCVYLWLCEDTEYAPCASNRNVLNADLRLLFSRFLQEGSFHITWDAVWWDLWPYFD